MSMRLSEHAAFDIQSPSATDVGGTTAATAWRSVKNFARMGAYAELGTWNSSDDLDHCRMEAAQDTSGTNSGELTTDASGGDYDTDSPIDADGDFVIIEARVEDLDVEGLDDAVRVVVGEDGNSGVDDVMTVMFCYGYAYPQKELQGAATAGSQVYVNP
tara:strand:- start:9042 stop:9518 length:477 start_codon:yes stop_codon:yes gene_type:complete